MTSLFQKFQEAVKVLARSPTFAKDGRHLQFEADINRLFLYTSYNRLGKNATEADADEIVDMASKASLSEQEKQVQENIHLQINTFCECMDDILLPDSNPAYDTLSSSSGRSTATQHSGLSLAVGRSAPLHDYSAVPPTKLLNQYEMSQQLKDLIGYTLEVKPSQIPHKDAGQGLYLDGEANVGAVIAIYPGVTYTPAYYRYIPGYPRVDLQNPYLVTRYDGTVINAQPWGTGGETREMWNGSNFQEPRLNAKGYVSGSYRIWNLLSKPLDGSQLRSKGEVLERRNPLAFAHFANHPAKDTIPNVMVCSYDFPIIEKNMRTYIPNVPFGNGADIRMKKFGAFWFKPWKSSSIASNVPSIKSLVLVATSKISNEEVLSNVPSIKSLVLVATSKISNEEVLLNYRLSNLKHRPSWYTPVDEDEDRRRWS